GRRVAIDAAFRCDEEGRRGAALDPAVRILPAGLRRGADPRRAVAALMRIPEQIELALLAHLPRQPQAVRNRRAVIARLHSEIGRVGPGVRVAGVLVREYSGDRRAAAVRAAEVEEP